MDDRCYRIGITRFTVVLCRRLRRTLTAARSSINLVSTVNVPEPGYSSEKLRRRGPVVPECSAVTNRPRPSSNATWVNPTTWQRLCGPPHSLTCPLTVAQPDAQYGVDTGLR